MTIEQQLKVQALKAAVEFGGTSSAIQENAEAFYRFLSSAPAADSIVVWEDRVTDWLLTCGLFDARPLAKIAARDLIAYLSKPKPAAF